MTVTGSIELLEAGDVDCIFGVERVPAEVTSKQAIVCTVPRSKTAGAVDLRLADASSDTTVGASVQFEYFVQPSVTAVMPSRGGVTGGTPYGFTVGVPAGTPGGPFIACLNEGIKGMGPGQFRRLIVPPEYAYGSNQVQEIPPNATLTVDVELLSIAARA